MTLSMAVMPMSNFPSIRLVSWNTDEGVGVTSTSSPSRAKKPRSWAAQIGQLNPPGKTITWRVSIAAPGTGTPRRARARSRVDDDPGLLDGRRRPSADPSDGRQRPVEVRSGIGQGSVVAARRARGGRHPGGASRARPARRLVLGVGGRRGAPVAADLHARPGGQHDRAARGRHLPVQGLRPRRRQRHALTMTPSVEQRRVVERVQRLTRERLAPRAADYDLAGQNPVESWRDLWAEGYLAAAIPRAHGGLGLDMPTYVAVIRTIAQGCANTAMTLHMHSTVIRFIDVLGTEAQKRRYFPEVVRFGKLFGSWGSEPAVSLSRTFLMETAIHRDGDDWVIEGVKHFCTMALGASYYMVWCALDGEADMGKALLQALVPAETAGIATDAKWNTLGMRATFSPSVTFKGVRIGGDATLGRPGSAMQGGGGEGFGLGYAAIYVGVAEAALAFPIDYARQRLVRPDNIALAQDPTVQRHIGELTAQLHAARLVLEEAAASWADADMVERTLLANRAKYLATEAGLSVTSKVIQVVGGRGAYKD